MQWLFRSRVALVVICTAIVVIMGALIMAFSARSGPPPAKHSTFISSMSQGITILSGVCYYSCAYR